MFFDSEAHLQDPWDAHVKVSWAARDSLYKLFTPELGKHVDLFITNIVPGDELPGYKTLYGTHFKSPVSVVLKPKSPEGQRIVDDVRRLLNSGGVIQNLLRDHKRAAAAAVYGNRGN